MVRSRLRQAALALGAGVALALAQVPFSVWPLGLAALMLATRLVATAASPRQGMWRALAFGVGHFAVALHWIVEPFLIDAARDGWMAPFALAFLALGLSLFWALAGWAAVRLGGSGRAARALAFALTLTAAEVARGHILTGFPWALPGHIWIGFAPMQGAALVGAYGLTLLTLVATALAITGRGGAMAGVAILGTLAAFGLWQGSRPIPPAPDAPVIRIVQPNAAQELKWDPVHAQAFFDRLLTLTATPADPPPDLVVWPETAVDFLLNRPGFGLDAITAAAGGAMVAFGVQRTEGARGFNSLAVLDPEGFVRVVYDKHHLVPFGEYIPFGDVLYDRFGISAFAAAQGQGYTPGPGPMTLDLGPLGRVMPLICYEAVFPQDLRMAGGRADWILHVTNDAWFGALSGPYQHLALARLRAVEQGVPVIRSANTGVSAVIDARGHVRAQIGLGEMGFLDAPLPPPLPPTLYAIWGEVPFAVLFVLIGALAGVLRRRGH